jgi:PAS domain S-box-containing protein
MPENPVDFINPAPSVDPPSTLALPMSPSLQTILEMLDSAPSSITVHDTHGDFLYANRRTFELHGYDKSEFLRLNLRQLDVPESAELIQDRLRLIEQTGHATFEVEHYRKDHSVLPLEVSVKTMVWEGRPALLSIARDLSEKRALQEKSMRHTRDLSLFQLFVVGLATVQDDEIHHYIAQSLKAFSGAYFVSISDYDPLTRCLAHRHLEIDPGIAGRLISLLGSRVEDIHTPLSEENYELVTRKGWTIEKSFFEAAFGSVPAPVAAAMQKFLHLDRFIGITFLDDSRLYGTSLLAMRQDQPDPSMDMLQAYRQAAAIALRHRASEKERCRIEREWKQARRMEIMGRLATSVAPEFEALLDHIGQRSEQALSRLEAGEPTSDDLREILDAVKTARELMGQFRDFEV